MNVFATGSILPEPVYVQFPELAGLKNTILLLGPDRTDADSVAALLDETPTSTLAQ